MFEAQVMIHRHQDSKTALFAGNGIDIAHRLSSFPNKFLNVQPRICRKHSTFNIESYLLDVRCWMFAGNWNWVLDIKIKYQQKRIAPSQKAKHLYRLPLITDKSMLSPLFK